MSEFKFKPDKPKYIDTVDTVENMHSKALNEISKKINGLNDTIKKHEELQQMLHDMTFQSCASRGLNYVTERANLLQQIEALDEEIQQSKDHQSELNYFQTFENTIFDYYNIIDEFKLEVPTENDAEQHVTTIFDDIPLFEKNSMSLLEQLHEKSKNNRKEKKTTRRRVRDIDTLMKESNTTTNIFQYINDGETDANKNRAQLYQDYILLRDGYKTQKIVSRMCPTCNIERLQMQSEGIFVCTQCGLSEGGIIESETNNYKEPIIEKPTFPYKRKNHFCEWLSQFQAKGSFDIPDDVIQQIKDELNIMRIPKSKIDKITIKKFKPILKSLKLNDYYNHIPHIKSKITGIPAPSLSRDDDAEFKRMFDIIQAPYEKFRPKSRINFLSYSYVLNKFCRIKGLTEYQHHFPLLKNSQKLAFHDHIWEQICREVGWEFHPSE
jgi:hypothetical protein